MSRFVFASTVGTFSPLVQHRSLLRSVVGGTHSILTFAPAVSKDLFGGTQRWARCLKRRGFSLIDMCHGCGTDFLGWSTADRLALALFVLHASAGSALVRCYIRDWVKVELWT